jgi:4-hydroxybenzoate polyprenyltransferase
MTTQPLPTPGFATTVRGLIRLTRWKEFTLYIIPLTGLGALMATQPRGLEIDWRLYVVMIANFLAVAYAFMINDIEDAPDDAREAERAARNPVACGEVSPRLGWLASFAVAALSLLCFAAGGSTVFVIGIITVALSHFYSWKAVRLKAYPVTDVVSHSLMLSGLLFVAGYFIYDSAPGAAWLVALAVTLISVYGQLYNQIRDYDMDVAAKLHNTAIMIGKGNAQRLMYVIVGLAVLMLIYSFVVGLIPFWIIVPPLLTLPLFMVVRSSGDARGGAAAEASGNVQMPLIIMINVAILAWLLAAVLGLV